MFRNRRIRPVRSAYHRTSDRSGVRRATMRISPPPVREVVLRFFQKGSWRLLHPLHHHLRERVPHYDRWHNHPRHVHIHLAVLGHYVAALVIVGVIIAQGIGADSVRAAFTQSVGTAEEWSLGTFTEADTQSEVGEFRIAADGTWAARTWAPPDDTITLGFTSTQIGDTIYALRGNGDNAFWRYEPLTNTWFRLASAPSGVYSGSTLTSDGSGTLYAQFGQYNKQLYKYTVATDTWEYVVDSPEVTAYGATLIYLSGDLYLLRASNTQDFWKYSLADEEWSTLAAPPATIGASGGLVWDGGSYFYLLRGNSAGQFYRYTLADNSWTTMSTNFPVNINEGFEAVFHDGALYMARGVNTVNFYRCAISGTACSGAAWESLQNAPANTRYGSLKYIPTLDRIVFFRGNNTVDHWRYNPDGNSFDGPQELPAAAGTGANLLWDGGNQVFYLRGANTTNFYAYNIATNTWASRSSTGLSSINTDVKAIMVGTDIYLLRGNNSATFLRYATTNDAGGWSALTNFPVSSQNGMSLAYPGSGDYLYATRGNGQTTFYRYSISGNSWATMTAAPVAVTIGGRVVADSSYVYLMPGGGASALYRYSISGNSWSLLGSTPYAQYYGHDVYYDDGKIFAIDGNYRNGLYEYDVAGNSWRRLGDVQDEATLSRGLWAGASLTRMSATSFLINRGSTGNSTELLAYTQAVSQYKASATYTSQVFDFTYVAEWNTLNATASTPGDSSVVIETRSSADAASWSSYQTVSGSTIASPANRYLQVRITLNASSDQSETPVVSGYTVNYDPDEVAPENPTEAECSSEPAGDPLIPGQTYRHRSPYCTWLAGTDGESGIAGYHVYFGQDPDANPITAGSYQTAATYQVTGPLQTGTYYLRVVSKDVAGNVAAPTSLFEYAYNGVSPDTSLAQQTTVDFSAGTLTNISAANDQLKLASQDGFWLEERLSNSPANVGAGAGVAYKASSGKMYVLRGGNQTTFWEYDPATDTWTALSSSGLTNVNGGGGLVNGAGSYLYAFAGNNTNKTYRYDITNDAAGWDDAAIEDAPNTLNSGANYVYDGSRYVYVLRGNSTDVFYRFDPQTTADGQWQTMAAADFGAPANTLSNFVYNGSSMAYDGSDTIYVIQGNLLTTGFSKYTISSNSWTVIESPLPVSPNTGALLMWYAPTQSLYYSGGGTRAFYVFDFDTEEWVARSQVPAPFGNGSAVTRVGEKHFVLRGGSNTVYTYYPEKDSWRTPAYGLFGPNYNGSTVYTINYGADVLAGDGDNLYLTRGNYGNEFVRYNARTGATRRLKNTPSGLYLGSSMEYVPGEGSIYLTAGQSQATSFFKYTIATDDWTDITPEDPLPANANYGSSLEYDGSRYLYYVPGGNVNAWYRYDTQAAEGARWSSALPTTGGNASGYGADLLIKDGYIYSARGQNVNPNPFARFDLSQLPGGSWQSLTSVPTALYNDGFLVDGGNGALYLARGGNTSEWWEYDLGENSWTQVASAPAPIYQGGEGTTVNGKAFVFTGNGTGAWADGLYSYIIRGDNSSFQEQGEFISQVHDLSTIYDWAGVTIESVAESQSVISLESRSSADGSGWSDWSAMSEGKKVDNVTTYAITAPVNRYVQFRFSFTSQDGHLSSRINSYTLHYYQDDTPPTNPSTLTSAQSQSGGGSALVNNEWYAHSAPAFTWAAADAEGGAVDNEGGSGVAGYYVYFGTDAFAQPATTGVFQESTSFTASGLSSGQTYYLRIQARDDAGNAAGGVWDAFTYRYDAQAPTNPETLTVSPVGYTNVDAYTFSFSSDATDTHSGVAGYQYRTGGDAADEWFEVPYGATEVELPNDDHPEASYRSGSNTFFIRAVDEAGNVASPALSIPYYFGADAPSPPVNLQVTPPENTENSFSFTWDAPSAYLGDVNKIIYHYSVNTLPNEFNTNTTLTRAAGPAAFATQKGPNRFYVVAEDEAGNVDWESFAYVDFQANTSAPPAPAAVNVSDISDKEGGEFRLVVSWIAPSIADPNNFAGYDIYSSTSQEGPFEKIANTSGTAYVHTGLSQDSTHHYYIQSVDKTGNRSAESSTKSAIATGRYTKPPAVVQEPAVEAKARSATITWATSRRASSAIEYGTTEAFGLTTGNSPTLLVTSHEVLLGNLEPDTLYYFRAVYVDEDGNSGFSEVGSFLTAPAPQVASLQRTDITLDSFWVSWDSNVPSYGEIVYGTSQTFTDQVLEEPFYTVNHRVRLTGLDTDTAYYFQVRARDEEGNIFTSDVYTQETLPLPIVSGVELENKVNVDSPTISVKFTTNVEASTIVRYRAQGGTQQIYADVEYRTDHTLELTNLQPTKEYELQVSARDRYGNEAAAQTHTITTKSDTLPPRIDEIVDRHRVTGQGAAAEAQLTVRVKVNEESTVIVEALEGTGTQNFNITSPVTSTAQEHTVVLRLGKPNTAYSYQVRVIDGAGNETVTPVKTVVVGRATKTAFEQILGIFSRSFGWLGGAR